MGLTADEGGKPSHPQKDWFKRVDLQLALGASSTTLLTRDPSARPDTDGMSIHQVPPAAPAAPPHARTTHRPPKRAAAAAGRATSSGAACAGPP